jgi:hypothetical protein
MKRSPPIHIVTAFIDRLPAAVKKKQAEGYKKHGKPLPLGREHLIQMMVAKR